MSSFWLERGRSDSPNLHIEQKGKMLIVSDGNIRYYEYENDSLHFLTEYKSSEPRKSSRKPQMCSSLFRWLAFLLPSFSFQSFPYHVRRGNFCIKFWPTYDKSCKS